MATETPYDGVVSRESSLTLRIIERAPRLPCGICGGPAAIELRGHTYCLHCTDAALERADIAAAQARAALRGQCRRGAA